MKNTKTKTWSVPAIKAGFAFLDVKSGRKSLEKLTQEARIPVTIKGYINCPNSHDDGVSMEFEVEVENLTLGKPKKKAA